MTIVAVTGAAGYIGRRLVVRLLDDPSVERILAIDIRPIGIEHPKLVNVQQDVVQPLGGAFDNTKVDTVVHLAFVLRQSRHRRASLAVNVGGAKNVLAAAEYAGVSRLVLMSSATIYGPHADNDAPLTEDAPLRPPRAFHYAWDKAAVEKLFDEYTQAHPGTSVSTLRGCVVMGPSANNFITTALFKPLLIGIRGCDPPMQFVHEDDLVRLLHRFVVENHPGVFNVGPPDGVRWSELARLAGKRMAWLPAGLAYAITNATWALRLQNDSPGVGLDFVRWPWIVDASKLRRELGFEFGYTSQEALEGFLRPRR